MMFREPRDIRSSAVLLVALALATGDHQRNQASDRRQHALLGGSGRALAERGQMPP